MDIRREYTDRWCDRYGHVGWYEWYGRLLGELVQEGSVCPYVPVDSLELMVIFCWSPVRIFVPSLSAQQSSTI